MANTNGSSGAGQTLATLEVPAEYVEDFRIGVLVGLESNGQWLKGMADEARQIIEGEFGRGGERNPDSDPFDSLSGPIGEAGRDAVVLRQLGTGIPKEPITIDGEASNLKYSLEATAHHAAERDLVDVEFGGKRTSHAIALLSWVAGEAARLEAEALPELERLAEERRKAKAEAV